MTADGIFGRKGIARLGLDQRTGLLRSLGIEDDATHERGSP